MNGHAWNRRSFCDHCDEATSAEYLADPFLLEVYNKKEYSYWCQECYDASVADI